MSLTAAQLLEEVRQLPPNEFDWLVQSLLSDDDGLTEDERFAAMQKEAGEPEPGYDEWFRAGVEASLADTSGDVSQEEVEKEMRDLLRKAREDSKLKATA
jgi:hypothetical protein